MKRQLQPSGSSSNKLSRPTQEKPVAVFTPLHPPPREQQRRHKIQRFFLHHDSAGVHPRVVHVRDDGHVEIKEAVLPSSLSIDLVGQSGEKLCFKCPSAKKLFIWDFKKEEMEREIDYDVPRTIAIGFGHTQKGKMKIVKFLLTPDTKGQSVCVAHIGRENERNEFIWVKQEADAHIWKSWTPPGKFEIGKFVSVGEDRLLFWKANQMYVNRPNIIRFDLETDTFELLQPPPGVENLCDSEFSLGHGFNGNLAVCVQVPSPSVQPRPVLDVWTVKDLVLDVWTLEKSPGGGDFWHRQLTLPLGAYPRSEKNTSEKVVPLSLFYGRGDVEGVNFLYLMNENQVFQINMRGGEMNTKEIVSRFTNEDTMGTSRKITFVCNNFKATPLPYIMEDKPGDRLSFFDDIE